MTESPGELVRRYLDRVVNQRDLTAVDEMVSSDFRGSGPGWPTTFDELRAFYEWQSRERPDWSIDVRESIEVGDSVVVRARAGGTITEGGSSRRAELEWLAHYRIVGGWIHEINVLSVAGGPNR